MKNWFLYLIFFGLSQIVFCQPNKGKVVDIVIHRVELGETVVMISKKYLVPPTTIYGANRFIIDGVSEGMVLQIPVVRKDGQEYATVQYPEPVEEKEIPTDAAIAAIETPTNTESVPVENEVVVEKPIVKEEPKIIEKPIIKEESVAVVVEPKVIEKPIIKEKPVAVVVEPKIIEKPIIKEEPVAVVVEPKIIEKPIIKEEPIAIIEKPTEKENTKVLDDVRTSGEVSRKMMVSKIERDVDSDYTVGKKETLYSISLKFDVSMEEILAINDESLKEGVKAGMVIKIPANKKIINWDAAVSITDNSKSTEVVEPKAVTESKPIVSTPKTTASGDKIVDGKIIHKVEPKETLYSLSKKYNTTVEIITANNENVRKSGLGVGFIIKIPITKQGESPATTGAVAELDKKIEAFKAPVRTLDNTDIIHKVVAKETLFSLATKYKVSVYDIRSNNESVMKNGLMVGQTLRIPVPKVAVKEEIKPTDSNNQIADNKIVKEKTPDDETFILGDIITTVQSTETIESIAKKYDVTPEEIIKNNANLLKDGKVKPGQVIKVPAKQQDAIEFSPDTFD